MTLRSQIRVSMKVNGEACELDVPASTTLADSLRAQLSLTGTKVGCDVGECGACTVLADGVPTLGCLVLTVEMDGHEITTIEGVADSRLSGLQRAFVEEAGLQCGFCTPGMILAASRLAADAGDREIRDALAGNICRCTGYTKIVAAIRRGLRDTSHAKRR